MNLFLSGVQGVIVTIVIFIAGLGLLHILSTKLYVSFANMYNNDREVEIILM